MTVRDRLLAALVAVIWGVNFVVIDEGISGIPPLVFAALRFIVVLVPAILLVRRPRVRWRVILAVGATTLLGQFALLYTALHLGLGSGLASLVLQSQVMFTAALAALALRERPSRRQTLGVLLGAVGLVIVGAGRSGATPLVALLLCLAAGLSWATGNVITRKAGVSSGLSLTVWSALVVPLPLLALSLVLDGPAAVGHALAHLPVKALLSTAYTAYLSTLVGYGLWNSLLARYPAAAVVPFTLLVPPVGILAAWLVQHEHPGPTELAGAAVVFIGVVITAVNIRRTGPPPAAGEAAGPAALTTAVRPEPSG